MRRAALGDFIDFHKKTIGKCLWKSRKPAKCFKSMQNQGSGGTDLPCWSGLAWPDLAGMLQIHVKSRIWWDGFALLVWAGLA